MQDFLDNLDLDNLRAALSQDTLKDEDAIDEMLFNKNKERLLAPCEATPKKRRKSNIMNMALTFQTPNTKMRSDTIVDYGETAEKAKTPLV